MELFKMSDQINTNPHIESTSSLPAALIIWEVYLRDQNKSEYTIKAFTAVQKKLTDGEYSSEIMAKF